MERAGSPSRSAATTRAPSASSPPCGAGRSAGRSTTSWPRWPSWPPTGVTEVTLLGQNVNSYGRDLHAGRPPGRTARRASAAAVRRAAPRRRRRARASAGCATPARTPRTSGPRRSRPWPRRRPCASTCTCRCRPAATGCWRPCTAATPPSATSSGWPRPGRAVPDLAVTTDLIVGFPGETDDDFARTLEVVAEAAYDFAYTFIFTPRPGTEAATMAERLRRPGGVRRALRAAAGRRRAVRARPPPRPHRPRRGGARRGPEQEGPAVITGRTRPEQARALPAGGARAQPARTPASRSPAPRPTT